MSKPIFKLSVLFLLVVFLLNAGFGCKGLSSAEKAATQAVSLEYWTVDDDVEQINALIKEYTTNKSYLSVTVRQLNHDEIYERLLEDLSEDKGPDIISVNNKEIRRYLPKLSPMPASVNVTDLFITKGATGQSIQVKITPTALPTAKQIGNEYARAVAQDAIVGGKIYGLPISFDTMAIYYNKDLLDQVGIPEPPKTWFEFQDMSKRLVKLNEITGEFSQSGAALGVGDNVDNFDDIFYILLEQSGIDLIDEGGYAVFNRGDKNRDLAPVFDVMNFYSDFSNPLKDTYSWNKQQSQNFEAFVSGRLAFYFGYSKDRELIRARAPQLNVEVTPMFQLSQERLANSADYWLQTVTAKSTHKQEAWGLVNYLTHSQANKKYLDNTGRLTALRAFLNEQKEDENLEPFAEQALIADNWYHGPDYLSARQALSDMLTEWLAISPNEDRLNDARQKILNRAVSKINQSL